MRTLLRGPPAKLFNSYTEREKYAALGMIQLSAHPVIHNKNGNDAGNEDAEDDESISEAKHNRSHLSQAKQAPEVVFTETSQAVSSSFSAHYEVWLTSDVTAQLKSYIRSIIGTKQKRFDL